MAAKRITRVVVREQGGFAGVDRVVANVDVSALPPEAQRQIEQATASAGFFESAPSEDEVAGFDLLQRVVTVTTEDGQEQRRAFVELGGHETTPMRRLIDIVQEIEPQVEPPQKQ